MITPKPSSLSITIVAIDPPFAAGDGVLFGLQSRREVEEPHPACVTTEFHTRIDVIAGNGPNADFTGEHVHGRRGDRFVYLAWGVPDQIESFVMIARAKIKLHAIPADLLDLAADNTHTLIAELQATNPSGQPATGTITPPAITWHARPN